MATVPMVAKTPQPGGGLQGRVQSAVSRARSMLSGGKGPTTAATPQTVVNNPIGNTPGVRSTSQAGSRTPISPRGTPPGKPLFPNRASGPPGHVPPVAPAPAGPRAFPGRAIDGGEPPMPPPEPTLQPYPALAGPLGAGDQPSEMDPGAGEMPMMGPSSPEYPMPEQAADGRPAWQRLQEMGIGGQGSPEANREKLRSATQQTLLPAGDGGIDPGAGTFFDPSVGGAQGGNQIQQLLASMRARKMRGGVTQLGTAPPAAPQGAGGAPAGAPGGTDLMSIFQAMRAQPPSGQALTSWGG